MLLAQSYGFNIRPTSGPESPPPSTSAHVGPSSKYASRAFVCFLSHSFSNPTRVLCFFFKLGTWKMRSLFQVEKRIWPQAYGCTIFKGKHIPCTFNY